MRCTIILAGLMVGTVSARAVADMVVRADGGVVVGRIVNRTDEGLEINTGDAIESRTVKLTNAEIKEVCSAAAEFERIAGSRSLAELQAWTAAYLSAKAETAAVLCARRCFHNWPKQAQRPPTPDNPELKAFWARTALQVQASRLVLNDAAGWLRLAERARTEGLVEDAARWIEFAAAGGKAGEIARARAVEWGLPIPTNIGIDFSPALDDGIEFNSLRDEGRQASAGEDRVFLYIPVRFDPRRAWTLSRATIKGRDAKGFYGLRPLRLSNGIPTLTEQEGEPVYERLDTQPETGESVYRNSAAPRRSGGESDKDRPGRKERRTRSEWVAVVIEIPRGASVASIQLPDEGAEELDLTLVRRVRERAPEWAAGQPKPELLAIIADRVARAGTMAEPGREPRCASIEVGLRALAAMRGELGDRATAEWNETAIDAALAAGGSGDPRVRAAAWRCLKSWPTGRAAVIERLAAAPESTRLRWAAQALRESMGPGADGGLRDLILRGLLRSSATEVCDRAIDVLQSVGAAANWYAVTEGSATAKALALGRVREIDSADVARACMSALVAGMDPRLARPTTDAARVIGLAVRDADEPVLQAWGRMADDAMRSDYLRALSGANLDAVWHSPAMQRLAMDLRDGASETVLAGWLPVLERRVRAARDAGGGAFPMLVARNSGDPLVMGLVTVAARGRTEDRAVAALGLLDLGFAEEVERAFGARASAEWIGKLGEAASDRCSDAWLGLLARWVGSQVPEVSRAALEQLDRTLARVDAADLWRSGAAIKSGISIEALVEMSQSPDPAVFGSALRVLYTIGHLTPQERQRLAADATKEERSAELRSIDRRRGRLVEGQQRVLGVVETTTRVEMPDGTRYWSEPCRRCLELPAMHLRLGADDESVTVNWIEVEIGRGRVIPADRVMKPAAYYYGVLEAMDGTDFSAVGTIGYAGAENSVADSQPVIERPGPLMLPSVNPEREVVPGAVTIRIGAYLRAALGMGGAASPPDGADVSSQPSPQRPASQPAGRTAAPRPASDADWTGSVPEDYQLTLRYVRFGGWVGVGPRVALPDDAEPGDVQFTNIMLIVERAD